MTGTIVDMVRVRSLRRVTTPGSLAGVVALIALLVAACGSGSASPSAGQASATAGPTAAASVTSTASGGSGAGQTDTEWGRIWDTLPSGFPAYPGALPGDETATGPASANLVVEGTDAKEIASVLENLLKQAGYTTEGASGPLENGSYQLDMVGPPAGCKIQVSATPTGTLTTLVVLYGAACPHD